MNITAELTATRELRAMMQGQVVLRGADEYARTRKIWNGAVENQPALFALCETSADVQAVVRVARRHGISFSVRGGGHHWAGLAVCPDGLVIDLSTMRQVIVDPHSQVATVQAGARLKDVAAAAGAHGLVTAMGNCGAVGMAGLNLGGGYGPLNGLYGLAADNLLGAEMAGTATGSELGHHRVPERYRLTSSSGLQAVHARQSQRALILSNAEEFMPPDAFLNSKFPATGRTYFRKIACPQNGCRPRCRLLAKIQLSGLV